VLNFTGDISLRSCPLVSLSDQDLKPSFFHQQFPVGVINFENTACFDYFLHLKRGDEISTISLLLLEDFDLIFESIRHKDAALTIDIQDIESKLFCNGQALFRAENE
jgi:hypothetical protein